MVVGEYAVAILLVLLPDLESVDEVPGMHAVAIHEEKRMDDCS